MSKHIYALEGSYDYEGSTLIGCFSSVGHAIDGLSQYLLSIGALEGGYVCTYDEYTITVLTIDTVGDIVNANGYSINKNQLSKIIDTNMKNKGILRTEKDSIFLPIILKRLMISY